MNMSHTPTPWTQYQLGATIYGADGFYVGIAQSKNPEADAALIVTAVNSFTSSQAELEALRSAMADLLSWFPDKPSEPEWRIKGGEHGADDAVAFARAALSGATSD